MPELVNITEELYHALYKYGRSISLEFRDRVDSPSRFRLDQIVIEDTLVARRVSFSPESLSEET